jgi:predicted RNase H-like HicB family nuclease
MIKISRGLKMGKFFTLEYWIDDDWYVGRLKEIPGVFSQGKNIEELKSNIHDAYNLMVDEENEALPDSVCSKKKEIQVEL